MAVSPADFYTYAKETGTPVARSREEQAALYPAVNQWKRSRISIPRTESKEQYLERNDLGGLETAATIGGIIGAGLLGRRYLKNVDARVKDVPTVTKAPTQSVEEVINKTANLGREVRETGGAGVRTDFSQPTDSRGIKTVSLESPWDAPFVKEAETPVVTVEASTEPLALPQAFSPLEYLGENKMVDPQVAYQINYVNQKVKNPERALASLGDEQIDVIQGIVANPKIYPETTSEIHRQRAIARSNQAEAANRIREDILSDQSINAIDAAEDQQTGRVLQQIQRNEDVNQNIVAETEEQLQALGVRVGAIDEVAKSLPDGPPVIQSEQRVGIAKEQLQSKRALLEAQGLRGTRLERQLQSDPEVQGLLKELSTPPKVVLPGQTSSALPPEEIAGVKSVQNIRDLDYRQADFYNPDDVVIDQTAQGRALRGGKITGGEIKYQDAGGQWVTDDITKRPTESTAPVKFTDYSYIDNQGNERIITATEKGRNYQALREGDPEAVKRARQAVEISEAQRIASDPRRVEQRTGRPARPQYMVEEQRRATKNQDPSIPLGGAMVTLRDDLQQLGPQEQRPVLRQGADGVEYYDMPDATTTRKDVGSVETSSAFTGPARFASGPVKGSQSLPEVRGDSSLYRQREIQPTQQSDSVLKIVDYVNNPSGQLQQINTAKIGPIGLPEQNVGSLPKEIELPGRPREAAMDQAQDFVADALAKTTVSDAPVVYPASEITERLAATQSPSLPPGYNLSRSTGQLMQNPQINRGVVERPQSFAGLNPKFSREDVNTYQIGQSTGTPLSPFIGPMGEQVATPVYPGVSNPPQRVSSLAYIPRREGSILGRTAQSPLPGQSGDNPARWLQTPTAGGARIAYPNITDDKRLSASFPRAGADATMLRTRRFKSDQDLKRYLNRGN